MSRISKSTLWAAAIIVAALISSANGLSDGASFGVVMGLTGAAWASLQAETGCRRGCLS